MTQSESRIGRIAFIYIVYVYICVCVCGKDVAVVAGDVIRCRC